MPDLRDFDLAMRHALLGLDVEVENETRTTPVILEDLDPRMDAVKRHIEAHRNFPVISISNVGIQEDTSREEAGVPKDLTVDPDADPDVSVQVGVGETYVRRVYPGGVCSWDDPSPFWELESNPTSIPPTRLQWTGLNRPFNIKYTISVFSRYESVENPVLQHILKKMIWREKPLLLYDSWLSSSSPLPAVGATLLGAYDLYPENPDGGGINAFRALDFLEGGFNRKELDVVVEAVLDLPEDPVVVYPVLTRTLEVFEVEGSSPWETYQPDQVVA